LAVPETAYAPCGDLSLAYQVFGEGDIDLVVSGSFVSHVELIWTLPEAKAFFDRVGAFCRVLLFDKAGVGLSDPVSRVPSIDDRASEIEAVMDAAEFDSAVLFGVSEGGPASMVFAAARPDRVKALILTGTFAWTGFSSWEDVEREPREVRERMVTTLGSAYAPSVEQITLFVEIQQAARAHWGSGEALKCLLPSVRSLRQLGMLERMSASPGMARATIEAMFQIDVRSVLTALSVPTLVIHATDDPIPVQGGRYLASHIAGAQLVEVEGRDHAPWFSDPDGITDAMERFLTGAHRPPSASHRALRSILFSDIVSSTDRASAMGDERWRALLERFAEISDSLASRFGGKVVKSTGDGHLATFEGPTQAIRCAEALRTDVESLGIEIRASIHTGECELIGEDIGGIAVHIAARILGYASAGEVLVSSAVRDLVVGSGIGFESRGLHDLRGVPGEWELLALDPRGARPGSPEAVLASLPTPSAQSGMRRTDRAVATMARRTPWMLRGLARVVPSRDRR
jgi:pimeloyl-ACP methyl ester carboxylesterase